jgi:hypothetical protein
MAMNCGSNTSGNIHSELEDLAHTLGEDSGSQVQSGAQRRSGGGRAMGRRPNVEVVELKVVRFLAVHSGH